MISTPTSANTALSSQQRDLADAIATLRRTASLDNATGLLQRIRDVLTADPMRGFLASILPPENFEAWWLDKNGGQLRTSGRGTIDWPTDRLQRVALQIDFCAYLIADGKQRLVSFARHYFSGGSSQISVNLQNLAPQLLDDLARDISRLAEQRLLSPSLTELLRNRPTSSDAILDGLLEKACDAFRDPAPSKQYDALKDLWDAFERAKTIHPSQDKKQGIAALLERASDDAAVRDVLSVEMKALSDIGNQFHIRHFETNRTPLTEPALVDYFFHRMLALLQALLPGS